MPGSIEGVEDLLMFAVDYCVFVDGVHVYAGKTCLHFIGAEDDMGSVPEPGWTCQQGSSTTERVSHG